MPKSKYKKRPDGRYCTHLDLGYDENGKRIRKTFYGKTIKELDEKILKAKIQINNGTMVKNNDTNFYEYAVSWMNTYKSITAINTKAMYENIIERHLKNTIGHLTISEITKSDIQNIINERYEHYETCSKIMLTLKQIFNAAIDDNMIHKSPAKNITMPPKPLTTKRALTELEKEAILSAELLPMQKCYLYILFYCGTRREETLALTKQDIDLKNHTISVNKAIVFDKNNPVISKTKNHTSTRTIFIPDDGFGTIKAYVQNCRSLYLFTKQNGDLMTQSSYTKFWQTIIKCLNRAIMTEKQWNAVECMPKKIRAKNRPINDLTAHIFRHNYATMLYYSGISLKKAAALMGHADTKMIMEVYSHLDDLKEQTETKLNNSIKMALK